MDPHTPSETRSASSPSLAGIAVSISLRRALARTSLVTSSAALAFALVAFSAASGQEATSPSSSLEENSATPAPTDAELAIAERKARIAAQGEHWSGLDRYELWLELEAGDVTAARKRILEAAASSDRDGAVWHIILEVESTELFSPYAETIRVVARREVTDRQKTSARLAKDRRWAVAEYLCGYVSEFVLHDEALARASYERLAQAAADSRGVTDPAKVFTDLEASASRQLSAITKRQSITTAAEVQP